MTVHCPLNKPQCKRSIMTGRGPFEKQQCPLSKPAKCLLAPEVCPMVPQPEGQCFLGKIQEVAARGCQANPGGTKCCTRRNSLQQRKTDKNYEMAEKPPCTRCSIGNPEPTCKVNSKNSKNTESRQEESVFMQALEEQAVERPRKHSAQKSARKKGKEDKNDEAQNAQDNMEEKIYRDAIKVKTEELTKNRNHLVVPQCSLASRRPVPCTSCLLELLSQTSSSTSKDTSRVYSKNEVLPCPFMRMMSLCDTNCSCPEVPPMDDEDEECPFLTKKNPTPSPFGCPLTRVRSDPLVLDVDRIAKRGRPFDAQKCPLVPGNCCYTAPSCTVHTEPSTMQNTVGCFCP